MIVPHQPLHEVTLQMHQSNRIPFIYFAIKLLLEQLRSVALVHRLDPDDVSIASGPDRSAGEIEVRHRKSIKSEAHIFL